jgi:hypothetical protein
MPVAAQAIGLTYNLPIKSGLVFNQKNHCITRWINDLKVCEWNGEKCPLPEYDKEKVFGILGREGSIGLQVHGGKGWPTGAKCRWRNIRIKRL